MKANSKSPGDYVVQALMNPHKNVEFPGGHIIFSWSLNSWVIFNSKTGVAAYRSELNEAVDYVAMIINEAKRES